MKENFTKCLIFALINTIIIGGTMAVGLGNCYCFGLRQDNLSEKEILDIYQVKNNDETELNEYINNVSNDIINQNLSDEEKVVAIAKRISDDFTYDYSNSIKRAIDGINYGMFDCVGYAEMFKLIASKCNIPVKMVGLKYFTEANDPGFWSLRKLTEAVKKGHAVDVIEINNKHYICDVCWFDNYIEAEEGGFYNKKLEKLLFVNASDFQSIYKGYRIADKGIVLD